MGKKVCVSNLIKMNKYNINSNNFKDDLEQFLIVLYEEDKR